MQRFESLRLPSFRHLASAYVVNEFGTWIGDVALAILVFDRTHSALATAVLFVALRFVPGLVGPPLTTRLEIISPRQILTALYLVEAVIFGILAVLAKSFSLPLVLVLAAFDGALAVAAKSLIRSVNANVLGRAGLLRQGIAIINLGVMLGGALGPALAGGLVAAAGAGPALGIDAVSFVGVALIIATAPGLRLESDTTTGTLGRLKSGVKQAWLRPAVRRLLLGAAATIFFGTSVAPIEVVFAKDTLHAGDAGYGLLMAFWGAGAVIGGVFAAAATRARVTRVIAIAVALIGAGYAGLAGAPNLAVACAVSVAGGVGNGLWVTAALSALQQGTPEKAQAAVMSVFESINQVMPGVGFLVGGAVTALSSPRIAYAVGAAGILVVLVAQVARPISGIELPHAEMPLQERLD